MRVLVKAHHKQTHNTNARLTNDFDRFFSAMCQPFGLTPQLTTVVWVDALKANKVLVNESWDDILRLAASLKKGWVTASLFISKLQALPRKSNLAKALQEYGKIAKTISILRYAISNVHR